MVMASISSLSSGVFNHTTYYDTLGICPSATEQDIKDAYRRLAILKHPDKNLADPAGACAAFQQLQTAYDTLSEPTLRTKYDASVLRSTNKPATPRNKRPSSRASGWRPATPPLQPSPPARPTAPKSRFPGTPPCARDTDRSSWLRLSQGWYEMSINCSLTREKIYREKMASLADQNNWQLRKYFHGLLQVELNHQASLRSELKVITARLFGLHD